MITSGAWSDLNKNSEVLSEETINVLTKIGFPSMTPVQKSVTPYLLGHKDVAVEAVTGSGKTLAYLVPSMEYIKKSTDGLAVLVLVPTRELAQQVYEVAQSISAEFPAMVPQYVIGGSQVTADIETFNNVKPTILIGTPGKLHELMTELPDDTFRKLSLFIVDEADQILRNGLGGTLTAIFQKLPTQRRTGLFSATMNDALSEIIKTGMRNPMYIHIKSSESQAPSELTNFYAIVDPKYKFCQLIQFIRQRVINSKCIVFVLNRQEVDFMTDTIKIALGDSCPQIIPFHGKMAQSIRMENLESFRKLEKGILLSTDVAARGIDIPDIEWIIQYDAPQKESMFIHRIGRTARIGRSGSAIVFLREHEDGYIDFLERQQSVSLLEMAVEVPDDSEEILQKIRKSVSSSEEFYLKSMKCVVAYVRSYSEHELNLLFRLRELDFIALAESFGLVRIPGMLEIKQRNEKKPGYLDLVDEWNKKHEDEWKPFAEKNYSIQDYGGVPEKKNANKNSKNDKDKKQGNKNDKNNNKKAPPKHFEKPKSRGFFKAKH
ncbi:DEAD/DEAH box helicase family protein [Trichomonas vaginalis G3]|uniref:ATP-dependent RNA helicase n=1 Tax=Trichomonas vaginalis (strain ATCC PRA-98 / G3) TaxID=412133 RepID=A2DEZ7_TRIV3|nr:helicase protein [Trichomonas vaginalis G3]EAY20989.1 DEAD/DEAH box helicase family protein [Trichomonas vaginalis G3]KAI5519160.1 helicase protein [Trichomonas vaginalis G3]|eukprot:XP_001581975.1 DEAD/DEAH box helicase family protein [Trichomonas vaginalis G3]